MIKCAIFDFDGTIANTEPVWCSIVSDILSEYGVEEGFSYEIWKDKYEHKSNISERLVEEYNLPITAKQMQDMRNERFMHFCNEEYLVKNKFLPTLKNKMVVDDLRSIEDRTHSCYLVTSSREDAVRSALIKLGIEDLFKEMYFSVENKEEVYKEIASKENVKFNDIIVYEDSDDNIELAKKLGMISYRIRN